MKREDFNREEFDRLAAEFRYIITDIICRSGSGHLGGALSLVEIVITLYWRIMRIDSNNPQWPDRDRLVMSKGHAGPVLYTALAYKGYFPIKELLTLNANGTRLPSHCDMLRTPGVDMTAGSLGQGLSAAAGMALAGKMDKKDFRVFCIIGDGESDEGQIWEAALFAGHHKLDNLIVITDYNKLQIDGSTKEILDLEPLIDKWRAFNWETMEMNGHNWDEIYKTINNAIEIKGKPKMIIAHTVKA
ncbi:MAG: transketolase, partial [bacterium]|nr:transketolase [bacterium]